MLVFPQSRMLAQAGFTVQTMATLSERIREAIETSGVSVQNIADACGISPQAVYDWMKGETKELMGNNLVELAELTGFEARWIAREVGPKRRLHTHTKEQAHVLTLMEQMSPYQISLVVKIADSLAQPPATDTNDDPAAA